MSLQDDSDIKIFGLPADMPDENDLIETAAFLNRQRSNGNIAKAKLLGEELAVLDPDKENGISLKTITGYNKLFNPAVINQAHALVVFIAQTVLHKRLKVQLLSSCAVNAMYDKIIETAPDFYNWICDGAAFTFYSLSLKDTDIVSSIGEQFAMLSGMEGDTVCIAFGSRMYETASDVINQIVDKYKFAGIG